MSDLSTREQIRGEAFRRVFDVMTNRCRHNGAWSQAWDACVDCRQLAMDAVDALGDLLPTGAEWGYHCGNCTDPDACDPSEPCTSSREKPVIEKIRSGCPMMRRYITDWIEVTE